MRQSSRALCSMSAWTTELTESDANQVMVVPASVPSRVGNSGGVEQAQPEDESRPAPTLWLNRDIAMGAKRAASSATPSQVRAILQSDSSIRKRR